MYDIQNDILIFVQKGENLSYSDKIDRIEMTILLFLLGLLFEYGKQNAFVNTIALKRWIFYIFRQNHDENMAENLLFCWISAIIETN